MKNVIIQVENLQALDLDRIHDVTSYHGYAILRGLVQASEIERSKMLLREWFDSQRDRGSRGENPADLETDFYQKFLLGATHPSGTHRPRCHRTIYLSLNFSERFALRATFITLARVRNLISELPTDFAIFEDSEGFWTPVRIHHYPTGGGFLVEHRDNFTPLVQNSGGIPAYSQPIVVMSRRGTDFADGGGFVVDKQGARVYYEDFCELGDIVLYSDDTIHGVEDVDPHLVFNQKSFDGRLSGLVTLYKRATSYEEIMQSAGVSSKLG